MLSPAEKGKDCVGGEASQRCEADTEADSPRPEAAVVAVVVELELATDHGDQGEDAPSCDTVPASVQYIRKVHQNRTVQYNSATHQYSTCPTSI